jgi:hypothetical protein
MRVIAFAFLVVTLLALSTPVPASKLPANCMCKMRVFAGVIWNFLFLVLFACLFFGALGCVGEVFPPPSSHI